MSKNFSPFPAGRTPADGPNSGQRFRDEFLVPSLKVGPVCIILDAEGYGSSFLEEAFGQLIPKGFNEEFLLKNLSFETDDETLVDEIFGYIKDEASR
ncbi:STAS-like domain-containing protein [Comamonas odontotermitis]|uniref:STAS-like domain-containing protein n=1 Tax=Comamonas odontotermitis TaxID=379895 RepID=UPI003752E400